MIVCAGKGGGFRCLGCEGNQKQVGKKGCIIFCILKEWTVRCMRMRVMRNLVLEPGKMEGGNGGSERIQVLSF